MSTISNQKIDQPSQLPSKEPSRSPSSVPSDQPSQVPSKEPSRSPSNNPTESIKPSATPSVSPIGPTPAPTAAPTPAPTVTTCIDTEGYEFALVWDETGSTTRSCDWICKNTDDTKFEYRQTTYCGGNSTIIANCCASCNKGPGCAATTTTPDLGHCCTRDGCRGPLTGQITQEACRAKGDTAKGWCPGGVDPWAAILPWREWCPGGCVEPP